MALSEQLATHREKAEAATGGRWVQQVGTEYGDLGSVLNHYVEGVRASEGWVIRFDDEYGTDQVANAQHLAANDPETVKAFIAVAEAAEGVRLSANSDKLLAALDNLSAILAGKETPK